MDGQMEARKREPLDVQMEKEEKIWTFEIINYFIYKIYKNYKKWIIKKLLKKRFYF